MEQILYKNYLKHLKENKTPIRKAISTIPRFGQILILLFTISAIVSLSFIYIERVRRYIVIPVIIEVVLYFASYYYGEYHQIKNSNVQLEYYKDYYKELYTWLQNFSSTLKKEENIKEIKKRIDSEIDRIEKSKEKTRDNIVRIIQVIVIPFSLAVFAAIAKLVTSITDIIDYGIALLLLPVIIVFVVLAIIENLNIHRIKEIENLKRFSDDLQGVIDTQFENALFKDDH